MAEKKGIDLRMDISADIGTITTDQRRLEQVILNLINNAVKFTEDGGITINIFVVDETPTHTKIKFEVNDTGIGINENSIKKLFQSFSQVDSSTTRLYGGSGLGLVISKNITSF